MLVRFTVHVHTVHVCMYVLYNTEWSLCRREGGCTGSSTERQLTCLQTWECSWSPPRCRERESSKWSGSSSHCPRDSPGELGSVWSRDMGWTVSREEGESYTSSHIEYVYMYGGREHALADMVLYTHMYVEHWLTYHINFFVCMCHYTTSSITHVLCSHTLSL